ncbi:class I SAM-dependent methyltransferase [Actinomadura montaniterrae]|uniref:Class I SAM-dependent methyltransferase n=1 Tax=Actinomadura montaniterrae TaxID=1803903 RepID=A0A6L3VWB4_9ACTN|nr:class I SAM-dependent methyltransferase [Actinomadura montaniterrae]
MTGAPGTERYTPGHDTSAIEFMAGRRAATHARFFLPHLTPGTTVLDLGCGPGTITADLAAAVAPGQVVGLDQQASQLAGARALARRRGLTNIRFRQGSCYDVPLDDRSVDRVFSHALMEHLAYPAQAMAEIRRVLRPGGTVGLCSPLSAEPTLRRRRRRLHALAASQRRRPLRRPQTQGLPARCGIRAMPPGRPLRTLCRPVPHRRLSRGPTRRRGTDRPRSPAP